MALFARLLGVGTTRARGVAGDKEQKRTCLARAREAVKTISDPDERRPIEEDIRSLG